MVRSMTLQGSYTAVVRENIATNDPLLVRHDVPRDAFDPAFFGLGFGSVVSNFVALSAFGNTLQKPGRNLAQNLAAYEMTWLLVRTFPANSRRSCLRNSPMPFARRPKSSLRLARRTSSASRVHTMRSAGAS